MLSKKLTPSPQRKLVSSETASLHRDVGYGPACGVEGGTVGDAADRSIFIIRLHSLAPALADLDLPCEHRKLTEVDL
jgi:hypothetical protein